MITKLIFRLVERKGIEEMKEKRKEEMSRKGGCLVGMK